MKEYDFRKIEAHWQQEWRKQAIYKVTENTDKPKCYVLDMFPYPSGAGLHVGHPLGYIASDIYARYKRLKGYNVLHPMGYDSFGLPAEQYAIQTGQHPAVTTEKNIARYREQLDKIGFCYDWDREVRTSDPTYYRWTQWIFIQLYQSWYNPATNKAEPIETLVQQFEQKGFAGADDSVLTGGIELDFPAFTASEWKQFNAERKEEILLGFRLAYLSEAYVNWCPALGTVLSNDEVKDGVSERGGYPVERKLMKQWSMRITAYAERLLQDLEGIDWTESLKDAQRNWIGKSQGASVHFKVQDQSFDIEVFTTRPDTIFGVSFIAVAPEYEFIDALMHPDQMEEVQAYIETAKNRSERERMADVKRVSGVFTGTYAIHPFTKQEIPIWVADYVLAGYGTGAVMGVPAHDSRDFAFANYFNARNFNLPVIPVIEAPEGHDWEKESYDAKEGILINSHFLNGLSVKAALKKAIEQIEEKGIGKGKTNYRLRDAIFGRQRYWGEPIPVYYKNGVPYCVPEDKLPLVLPEVDKFLPTEDGEPPLARADKWKWNEEKGCVDSEGYPIETTTMPGWAGSSWYFLRYMDPTNSKEFVSKTAADYWQNVDLYLGGSEHATGHLLYVRFWTKFLYDRGLIAVTEPAKKLINQGMIQGMSDKIYLSGSRSSLYNYRLNDEDIFLHFNKDVRVALSCEIVKRYLVNGAIDYNYLDVTEAGVNVPIEFVKSNKLDVNRLVDSKYNDLHETVFINNSGVFYKGKQVSFKLLNDRFESNPKNIGTDKRYEIELDNFDLFVNSHDFEFTTFSEVEKMSKSKHNVVTPDAIIEDYGADTLRLYEMFLGPLEQSKPWSTQGIEGVHRFLKKLWKLFYNAEGQRIVTNETPDKKELKSLHKLIKKVGEDIEGFSFNTSVSSFMICVNELTDLKCSKRSIMNDLLICLSPYAPHIAEHLWHDALENEGSIVNATFPVFNAEYLVEDSFSYPISINGKHRTNIEFSLQADANEVEQTVLADETVQKWLEGKAPKKVVFVKGKIVNIVV